MVRQIRTAAPSAEEQRKNVLFLDNMKRIAGRVTTQSFGALSSFHFGRTDGPTGPIRQEHIDEVKRLAWIGRKDTAPRETMLTEIAAGISEDPQRAWALLVLAHEANRKCYGVQEDGVGGLSKTDPPATIFKEIQERLSGPLDGLTRGD